MRRCLATLLLLALAGGAAWADAPETGTVSGTVTDPGGSELPGVNLTISGERGEKFTVSQADGGFRFALMVPGNYTLKAELEGLGEATSEVTVTGRRPAQPRHHTSGCDRGDDHRHL